MEKKKKGVKYQSRLGKQKGRADLGKQTQAVSHTLQKCCVEEIQGGKTRLEAESIPSTKKVLMKKEKLNNIEIITQNIPLISKIRLRLIFKIRVAVTCLKFTIIDWGYNRTI